MRASDTGVCSGDERGGSMAGVRCHDIAGVRYRNIAGHHADIRHRNIACIRRDTEV